MKIGLMVVLAALIATHAAVGQEPPKYDVLKKMYDDSVASLKASQDAKNQLATKNEELTRQIAELKKQLDAVTRERDELQREAAGFAEKTYWLRSQLAAWDQFLKRYPILQARWRAFLDTDLIRGELEAPSLAEPAWPFKVEG